jgi:hypothetical protein
MKDIIIIGGSVLFCLALAIIASYREFKNAPFQCQKCGKIFKKSEWLEYSNHVTNCKDSPAG